MNTIFMSNSHPVYASEQQMYPNRIPIPGLFLLFRHAVLDFTEFFLALLYDVLAFLLRHF